jgi:antirestriction protein ArdC
LKTLNPESHAKMSGDKADKRAFFTACSQASKAADYLRGLALAEPSERAA